MWQRNRPVKNDCGGASAVLRGVGYGITRFAHEPAPKLRFRMLAYLRDRARILRSVRLAAGHPRDVFQRPAKLLLGLVCALLLTGCEQKLPSPFKASDVTAQYVGADFHLRQADGKPVSLADYRGKVVALFFGYTHCPDVCPTTLADMARVMDLLGEDAKRVQVLFVTLDPERDTAELLAQYPPAFHPSFRGLRGDAAATAEAARAFGIQYQKVPTSSGYNLDHSAGTFLIAPSGQPVLLSPFAQRPEHLAQDIKLLLALQ